MIRALPLLGLALCGCKRGAVTCEVSPVEAVRTVVRLTVTSDEAPSVAYGETAALGEVAAVTSAGEGVWEALLIGLPALTDAHFAVDVAGEPACEGVARTGGLPSGLPDFTVTVDAPELQDPSARWFLAAVLGEPAMVMVFDRQARTVWYGGLPDGLHAIEAQVLPDGFWHNQFSKDRTVDAGGLRRVSWAGEELEAFDTPLAHHVFTRLDDGTLAWLALDVRDWTDPETGETEAVVGDAIVERDPSGAVRTVFSVWDALDVTQNERWHTNFYPQGRDWTHANALRHHSATDAWLMSLGHEEMVLSVSRASGEVLAAYGTGEGLRSDAPAYPVAEGSTGFTYQHDASLLPDGHLLMFATHPERSASAAVEYAVEGGELVQVWDYGYTEGRAFSPLLGQATRLGNGNTLINYGGTGLLREVTPSGEVAWELQTGSGSWFGQVRLLADFTSGESR